MMRRKFTDFFAILCAISLFSGCTVEDAANPDLYGQKCEGANELNRCPVTQYCNNGKCEEAGPVCERATEYTNEPLPAQFPL